MNADLENLEPLYVKPHVGQRLIGSGKTKWHELVNKGLIEIVEIDGHPHAVYASLKRLGQPRRAA